MTNREIYDLLLKIDQGYKPTQSEKKDLELVDSIRWRNIDYGEYSYGKTG